MNHCLYTCASFLLIFEICIGKIIKPLNRKKNYKKNKKLVIKKKDLIIAEQKKKKLEKELLNDKKYIHYLFENVDDNYPYKNIQNIKNDNYKKEQEKGQEKRTTR